MQRHIIVQVTHESKTQLQKQCFKGQQQGYKTELVKLNSNREGTAKLYKSDKNGSTEEQEKTY